MEDEYEEYGEPEPGPGFVAHIAIVVARDGDDRVLDRMDRRLVIDPERMALATVEIRGQSLDDLACNMGSYSVNVVKSIGDPGHGNSIVAVDESVRLGMSRVHARRGGIRAIGDDDPRGGDVGEYDG